MAIGSAFPRQDCRGRLGRKNRIVAILLATAIYCGILFVLESATLQRSLNTQEGVPPSWFDNIQQTQHKNEQYPSQQKHLSLVGTHRRRIPRLINDVTIKWDETMDRPWLSFWNQSNQETADGSTMNQPQPPFMILLTDWGWNHPNQTYALSLSRSLRERELFSAIVNHPYFHPTGWEDIRNGILSISATTNYYVFADVSQCMDANYPTYGKLLENLDGFSNRTVDRGKISVCMKNPKTFGLLEHPLFQNTTTTTTTPSPSTEHHKSIGNSNNKTATLVTFNCKGWREKCPPFVDMDPALTSVAAMGGSFSNMVSDRDQGLMPPAPNPVRLSKAKRSLIANCAEEDNRPLTAVYVGNFRNGKNEAFNDLHDGGARKAYRSLHNPFEGVVVLHKNDLDTLDSIVVGNGKNNNRTISPSYHSLLRSTKFALVPRGDNKFSYRFTEALSAGAIPVFHGDDHVLPFRPEVVDWNRCGLFLPERDAGATTLQLLKDLERNATNLCSMRQYCYFEIYQKYVVTPTKQINGLLQGLEALARGERKEHAGLVCNETSVANLDCNPI